MSSNLLILIFDIWPLSTLSQQTKIHLFNNENHDSVFCLTPTPWLFSDFVIDGWVVYMNIQTLNKLIFQPVFLICLFSMAGSFRCWMINFMLSNIDNIIRSSKFLCIIIIRILPEPDFHRQNPVSVKPDFKEKPEFL